MNMKKIIFLSMALCTAFYAIPVAYAASITVESASSKTIIHTGETADIVVTFTNNESDTKSVLLDAEIYRQESDGTQTKAGQMFMPASFNNNSPAQIILTMNDTYAPGRYIIKAGVFNSGWQGLIQWHDHLQEIQVLGSGDAAPDNNVSLTSHSVVEPDFLRPGMIFATFDSPTATNTVLIDLELYDSNNNKVHQEFSNNQTIPQGTTLQDMLIIPRNLPAGTYRFAVGIFTPQWKRLIKWYDSVEFMNRPTQDNYCNPRGTC
jgi:hypothetical protein